MTVDNIKEVAEAGVDMFVAGSAILKAPRTQDAYRSAPPPCPPHRRARVRPDWRAVGGARVACRVRAAPAGDGLP